MKRNTTGLLLVAIVAIGIFALPQTAALFSGQHSWYNLSDDGNQIPCVKCHGDINAEMIDSDNGVHKTLASPGCDCHRVEGTGVADGDGVSTSNPGTTSHAAETIACMLCHNLTVPSTPSNIPYAGGFAQPDNTTWTYNDTANNGSFAAHNPFIQEAIDDDLMMDSNEACIACHTRVGVNISWTKNVVLDFDADENDDGDWTLSNWAATGSNLTESTYKNNWTNSY